LPECLYVIGSPSGAGSTAVEGMREMAMIESRAEID
jgi:hypothetical protein